MSLSIARIADRGQREQQYGQQRRNRDGADRYVGAQKSKPEQHRQRGQADPR
jgi:hypothetical protein